ncbi:MAG: 4Fe-4S dicluster domain-containing protein [Rubrivivax sp.]
MKTLICDCNRTMPLDAPALARALSKTPGASADGLDTVHTLLCRREAGAFQRAAKESGASGDELLVACTQEQSLFLALNAETEGAASVQERPIHFVNIREVGGWSRDAAQATPKLAALIAAAQLPAPDPVATVSYTSAGRCLVIGRGDDAERAAVMLEERLDVSVLASGGGRLMQAHRRATHSGSLTRLSGWLGSFEAEWESSNPIDLDVCTRCNACIDACPEGAIGFDYRIDLDACRNHRDCVRVCDAAGAIDFSRAPLVTEDRFDLVLDLRPEPAFRQHQPPQGYFHAAHTGSDSDALVTAVLALRELTGTFDKPKFFNYQHKLCAHSRNEQIGCTACIDVCSTQAIRSDASKKNKPKGALAGGVIVEPHLCVGCGACTTVCPSGAMGFAYPNTVDQGRRLRTMLAAYRNAGPAISAVPASSPGAVAERPPALLIHSEIAGTQLLDALGRAARTTRRSGGAQGLHGVPARVLPVAVWHTASIGIDLWLAAIAQGANQIWVLMTDEEAPEYRQALTEQMAVAQALLSGLGYGGQHLRVIDAHEGGFQSDLAALDAALRAAPATGVARPAAFAAQADKRATLELALDHLLSQAPQPVDEVPLPAAGAPFGTLVVDPERCTLCLSCVSACPEAALADNPDAPQLKFIEKNCVQCGLCASTCPEDAITLQPRLWFADGGKARKAARVLNEMEPYACIRCGKPFGTLLAIQNMVTKLSGHSAFQGAAAERLKMCGDCRVIDLHSSTAEVRITDL